MPQEKLSLAHKEILHNRLKSIPVFLSEYSFANLYLFRKTHDYQVLFEDKEILISGKTYDGHNYLMPTRQIYRQDLSHLLRSAKDFDFLFPIPEEWLGEFAGEELKIDLQEGDSDYIYRVDKMATYQGPQMHGKKNLLNQFLSAYSPQARPLTRDLMPDAKRILDAWQAATLEPQEQTDYFPCSEALDLYDELVLCGGIYYVGQEPVGFIIGEEFNQTMFALHFAKGKKEYKGIYQYMFHQFASILPKKYEFLNFEQDLGKQALRVAKSSYHPDRILKKYRVRVN